MLMTWDFTVDRVSTQTAAAEAPKVPTEETLPAAPLLDTIKLTAHCNWSLFSRTNGIFFGQEFDEETRDEGKICFYKQKKEI